MVLGINPGPDSLELLENFVDTFQISFPILPDNGVEVHAQYRQPSSATPFPLDYIIDQAGLIASVATEYDPEGMQSTIDTLLGPQTAVPDLPPVALDFGLLAAPNPFNPATELRFELPRASVVSLAVVDARGRLVRRLMRGTLGAGEHRATWDGRDDRGRRQASGGYLAVLGVGGVRQAVKLTLVE